MVEHPIEPIEEVPEADLLEQHAPLVPDELGDEPAALAPDSSADIADEADWLDQQATVPDHDEEDYLHE